MSRERKTEDRIDTVALLATIPVKEWRSLIQKESEPSVKEQQNLSKQGTMKSVDMLPNQYSPGKLVLRHFM